jgi:hypothetical protein
MYHSPGATVIPGPSSNQPTLSVIDILNLAVKMGHSNAVMPYDKQDSFKSTHANALMLCDKACSHGGVRR